MSVSYWFTRQPKVRNETRGFLILANPPCDVWWSVSSSAERWRTSVPVHGSKDSGRGRTVNGRTQA
jgi:hypothetical protein